MPNVREFPYDPKTLGRLRYIHYRHAQTAHRPLSDIEALMQMAPGDRRVSGADSIISTLELKEAVGIIVDSLPPEDPIRDVIHTPQAYVASSTPSRLA